jgi:hypothetical protein
MAANNITQLSTANTFQHWLTATQLLIATANSLTDGKGSTFYANTKLEVGGNDSSLNVTTTANINSITSSTITTSNLITGNLAITYNISSLNLTSTLFVGQNQVVYGNSNVGGILTVTGNSTLTNVNVTNTLTVVGNTTLTGTLGITGNTSVGNLNISGALTGGSFTIPNSAITGVLVSSQIADGAITNAKLASGIAIPSPISNSTFYLTSDGTNALFKAQTSLVIANTQVTGLITSAQIASVANTQITGLITSAQIASVANTQITGLITSAQIASVANTQITGFGTGVSTALGVAIGSAGSVITNGGALGTPSSGTLTNCTFPTLNQNTTGSANTFTSTIQNSQFNSIGVGTAASGTAGEILAIDNITAYYSDEKLKTKLGNIDNALDKILTLNGFYYEANEIAQALGYKVKREVGISAQEVQAIMPEVVAPAPIDDKYLTVRYERLVPLLIEAIKELTNKINVLESNQKN